MRKLLLVVTALLAIAPSVRAETADKPTLAFVTNSRTSFWRPAEAGLRKAQSELPNYRLLFQPLDEPSPAAQTRLLDELVAAGVVGIVFSPVDTKSMGATIDRLSRQATIFTMDSDIIDSKRAAYFGSSNVDAGRQAGSLLRKALPAGAKCMGFVGLLQATNTQNRVLGMREALKGSMVELVDVLGDDFDKARARRNVLDTLSSRPEITCMVGFYDYNTPVILEALAETGRQGQIKVVAFDEETATLKGIKDGTVLGTVVQQAYEWGYLSMLSMARFLEGRKSFLPPNGRIILPTRVIDKDNVDPYWTELKAMLCCLPAAREMKR
ncbi:substrate-binding domain-containing protein [Reyranella sp.]|uniref:substrate-binding domain-containing protein n=1 Tax=Reyranella sp. TaxID=1929291 RepID=UPI0040363282